MKTPNTKDVLIALNSGDTKAANKSLSDVMSNKKEAALNMKKIAIAKEVYK